MMDNPMPLAAGSAALEQVLTENTVACLVRSKRRLLELPYTSTAEDVVSAMLTHNILAMPVAAPPWEWIGAGGSSVIVNDPKTGVPRKQYIGIVSVLDVMMQVAEAADNGSWSLEEPVATLIGHSLEGLSLWVISPETTILDALEPFGKGIHRVLVPAEESHAAPSEGAALAESSPYYHFCSQTDIIRFLHNHAEELSPLTSKSVQELGAVRNEVLAISSNVTMADALKCMRTASLSAVPIMEADTSLPESEPTLVQGKGRKIVGTVSASDLRGCTSEVLKALPKLNVLEFLRRVALAKHFGFRSVFNENAVDDPAFRGEEFQTDSGVVPLRPTVSCTRSTSLAEVMAKALENGVHRVWVIDSSGNLDGVVTFTDIIKVVWKSMRGQNAAHKEDMEGAESRATSAGA